MQIRFVFRLSSFLIFTAAISFISLTVTKNLAQESEKPTPWFSITISEYRHDWFSAHRAVRIELKNISNEPRHIAGCAVERGLYTTAVRYNGALLQERGAMERRQREAQWRRTYCKFDVTSLKAPPGVSAEDFLLLDSRYDMSNPGTYEIVIARETDPEHPEKSTTVQSNTLKVTVGDSPR